MQGCGMYSDVQWCTVMYMCYFWSKSKWTWKHGWQLEYDEWLLIITCIRLILFLAFYKHLALRPCQGKLLTQFCSYLKMFKSKLSLCIWMPRDKAFHSMYQHWIRFVLMYKVNSLNASHNKTCVHLKYYNDSRFKFLVRRSFIQVPPCLVSS